MRPFSYTPPQYQSPRYHLTQELCAAFTISNNKSIGIRQAHYLIRIQPQCSSYCFPAAGGIIRIMPQPPHFNRL